MAVLDQIRRAIQEQHLIFDGDMVVVGVSGGPDSVCLLHAMAALRDELAFGLHVAHLNHQLRGTEADADAQFVGDLARGWGLPCTVGSHRVSDFARERKLSIEEAAREARYAFLAETARAVGGRAVAVAHNADDQAESVLMHFLRGSGTSGLRGMLPASDLAVWLPPSFPPSQSEPIRLIRPLLAVPRAAIDAYCRAHDLKPRLDHSNLDTTFFRNRLRHELLPQLETYNPNIRAVLRRTAEVVAAEVEVLRAEAASAWRAVCLAEGDGMVTLNRAGWHELPLALQRATLREAIGRLRPSLRNINFVHVEDAARLVAEGAAGARMTLPHGLLLRVEYTTFTLGDAARAPRLPDWPLLPAEYSATVSLPGKTRVPDSGWTLDAAYLDAWGDEIHSNSDRWQAYLDGDAVEAELRIRAREPGDLFHPQGMPAPVRLTNWMTNAKVPRAVRDRLPLVVAGGRLAWVCGFRIGQPFLVTPAARRVIRLRFHRA